MATPYGYAPRYSGGIRRPGTFLPRPYGTPPIYQQPIGAAPVGANLAGIIGGLAAPLLCLGCLASLALLGLFATMIGAAAYMNKIQKQIRNAVSGDGNIVELNILILLSTLLFSLYIVMKSRRQQ